MRIRFNWLLCICLLSLVSCVKELQPIKVAGISINPTSISLVEGEASELTATISPKDADNQSVTWDSNDKSVATVSNGKVIALKEGSASITVKSVDGGFTASCAVTVLAKTVDVSSILLSKSVLTLTEGDSETITATVKPDDATDKTVSWSSSDTAVATVEGGMITAVKEGEAVITACAGDKTTTCKVTVEKKAIAVESIELDKTEVELTEGESATLVATVKPDNAINKSLIWSSSNPSVAIVDDGVVTAIQKGTTTITVETEEGAKTASCFVCVKPKVIPVSGVSLNKHVLSLPIGGSEVLVASIAPEEASNKDVVWISSDPTVAKVDSNGKVTAIKKGLIEITVTTVEGGFSDKCSVIVGRGGSNNDYSGSDYQW